MALLEIANIANKLLGECRAGEFRNIGQFVVKEDPLVCSCIPLLHVHCHAFMWHSRYFVL